LISSRSKQQSNIEPDDSFNVATAPVKETGDRYGLTRAKYQLAQAIAKLIKALTYWPDPK
jgi:hypothetical protein